MPAKVDDRGERGVAVGWPWCERDWVEQAGPVCARSGTRGVFLRAQNKGSNLFLLSLAYVDPTWSKRDDGKHVQYDVFL